MMKIGIVFLSFAVLILSLSGCTQDEFVKANIEYNNEYFELCKSVITDTKEISKRTAYETAKLLQSNESASRLQRMKDLLAVMEKHKGKKDVYSFVLKTLNDEYNRVTAIKDSYSKWDQLSDEQKINVAREYGIMHTLYGVETSNRAKGK